MGKLPGAPQDIFSGSIANAVAVTPGGTVIVGGGNTGRGYEAFRWTADTGMVVLPSLPGATNTQPLAVNADGSVIVGSVDGPGEAWPAARRCRSVR